MTFFWDSRDLNLVLNWRLLASAISSPGGSRREEPSAGQKPYGGQKHWGAGAGQVIRGTQGGESESGHSGEGRGADAPARPLDGPPREPAEPTLRCARGKPQGQTFGIPRRNRDGARKGPTFLWPRDSGGTSASSALISCLSLQPTRRCPARRPRPLTREGALSWVRRGRAGVEAPRPERADSAHAQKPCRRFRGCRKARGSVPAQAPHCPGQSQVSPAGHPRPRGGSAPEGRARIATWAATLWPESREAPTRCR